MQLEEIIHKINIPDLKKRLQDNKRRILFLKRRMSDLTFCIDVAKYAYTLDNIEFLEQGEDEQKIKEYQRIAKELERNDKVRIYAVYRKLVRKLEEENKEYFKAIQIALRSELLKQELPDIYVYQGCLGINKAKLARHIIIPGILMTYREEPEGKTIIYPGRELSSKRELRKFYNKVSYKYLEQLTMDNSFDLDTKRLGKVKKITK